MSEKNEQVLQDIRGKIEREQKLVQGFQTLKRNTSNAEVIQRCNTQIRETQSNIDYLQETLSKLTFQQQQEQNGRDNTGTNQNQSSPDEHSQPRSGSRPVYSRLDLIKYDCPSLGHRIQYMLQQLEFKLQVENQYRQANEKISQLYLQDGDKSSSVAAEGGRLESDQRIQLLNKSLKKYQGMHIDVEEVTKDMEIMNTPKYARKALTGKLNISITCIRDINHIASPMLLKKPESVVSIKVDDVEKARTKGSRTGKWNEEFSFDIDKGHEIELTVYDKSGNVLIPVAVTWALLSDIAEEIRKKKVALDMGNAGWISASNLSNLSPQQQQQALQQQQQQQQLQAPDVGFGGIPAVPRTPELENGADSSGTESYSAKQIQVTSWLILEPVGQILVSMNFEKSTQTGNKNFMGALGRHGAIRQKKEEVYEQLGHQFVQKQFYNIMCCALCGEFLRYTGYQCQDCKFLCHKKCYQKVVTKCISKSNNDIDPDEAKLNHRIPHRFEPVLNRGTKWCCHCGYILPWGRKNVRKCTECGVMCHAHCTHLVPDFCGMTMLMANKILTAIKTTKPKPKATEQVQYNQQQQPTLVHQPKLHQRNHSIQQGTESLSSLPTKKADSFVTNTNDAENLTDEEDEKFNSRLPTQTTNQYQPPIESPYKNAGRRIQTPRQQEQAHEHAMQQLQRYQDQQLQYQQRMQQQQEQEQIQQQHLQQQQLQHQQYQQQQHELYQQQQQQQQLQDDYDQHNYTFASTRSDEFAHASIPSQNILEPIHEPVDDKPVASEEQLRNHQVEHAQAAQSSTNASPRKHSKRRRRKVGLDDFQFLAVLGKGNFGKVMLAESRHTLKLCAIKVLKKDFIVENDEADSVKSEKGVFLTANKEMHPFLINLHCCFQTENRIYFVMEYISGGDLMWHIQKSRFSAKRAKFYACEVLLALKYFHDNGVVYRDLKLDNILLTVNGHIKIADYGLCKEKMPFGSTTGTFCGTPEFMAPEIIAGKQYERSVDWWAFGVLLFQMLLCQSPFKGDDEDEIFNAIEHDDVRYPISMPRQTVLVLQALLTKDPTQRLGYGERDALDIMEHSYFSDVDFDEVLNCQIQAPYLPEITSEHDYSNFDNEFTSETPRLTPVETVLTSEMQEQFRGFSYISNDAAI